jgi:hypothetical protein
VLELYVQRDLSPAKWTHATPAYDVMTTCRRNTARTSTGTHPSTANREDAPALSKADIEDVLAFLRTLTDADLLPQASGSGQLAPNVGLTDR